MESTPSTIKGTQTMARNYLTLLMLCLGLTNHVRADDSTKKNVVFFLVDDLGFMDIGTNNPDTFYETPNIDRLAASGMRFTNGYAANPVCSPTRYSIMTGKYPSRIDATNYFSGTQSGRFNPAPLFDRMPLEETTIAEALKQNGYATFFAGKWHLGPTQEFWPTKQGFDVNKGGFAKGGPYGGDKYFSPYGNPRLEDGPKGEHLPDRLSRETAEFIEQNQKKPFFTYLSFYSVHTPLMAPEALVAKYQAKAIKLGLTDKTAFGTEETVGNDGKTKQQRLRILQNHAVYAAMVESMDKAVGRVLDKLDELKLADDTIVILTSDNGGLSTSEGWPTSNLPLRGGKGWVYEGGIREAFMVRAPVSQKQVVPVMYLYAVLTSIQRFWTYVLSTIHHNINLMAYHCCHCCKARHRLSDNHSFGITHTIAIRVASQGVLSVKGIGN